jgi:Ser/Thr protein kinase RdoA (MazF antagonist)
MVSLIEFLNERYTDGPYAIQATFSTNGQRQAYRVQGASGCCVLKLTDPGREETTVRADVGTPAYLSSQGFPAPRPVAGRDGQLYYPYGDRFVYLSEYIAGEYPRPCTAFYHRLGKLLARLHNLPVNDETHCSGYRPEESLPVVREALLRADAFIGEVDLLAPDARSAIVPELLEIIDRFPSFDCLPQAIIHTDPWLTNLIETSTGDLYLIDWEDGGVSYPLQDVGYVLSYMVTFTTRDRAMWGIPGPRSGPDWHPDWGREFLAAYQSVRPLNAEEQRLLPDAIRMSFLEYIPCWGTTELIVDNYCRMKLVEEKAYLMG